MDLCSIYLCLIFLVVRTSIEIATHCWNVQKHEFGAHMVQTLASGLNSMPQEPLFGRCRDGYVHVAGQAVGVSLWLDTSNARHQWHQLGMLADGSKVQAWDQHAFPGVWGRKWSAQIGHPSSFFLQWAIRFGSESGKQGSGSQPDNKLARKSTKEITFLKVGD